MKTIAVFAALMAVALAAPQFRQQQQQQFSQQPIDYSNVVLLRETQHNNIGLDGYRWDFEQSDGQKREEQAEIAQGIDEDNRPTEFLRVRGSYSFVGADGVTYTVNYVADENGFRAEGAHLPVPPV